LQVPSAFTPPHSYFGQQLAGSVPTCFAHGHRIAGQTVPVLTHVGHLYVWQHVSGSIPDAIGVVPSGQATASVGQTFGLLGSQVGFAGTHCPSHDCPLQFPSESQTHVGSPAGHAHVDGGTLFPVVGSVVPPVVGSVVPLLPPLPEPVVAPTLQPQPEHVTEHSCPVGQSLSALQPFWMFGTQTPKQSDGHDRISQPQLPSAFSRQRPVGPAFEPSAQR